MPVWMIVEDEADIHDFILAMFEIWGIRGVAFDNGLEALAWLEQPTGHHFKGDLPELALIDIRLPDIPGPEIGARLRQQWGDKIGIVLVTAYRLTPEEQAAVIDQAQADMLIYKPLPPMVDLRDILDRIIEKHNAILPRDSSSPCAESTGFSRMKPGNQQRRQGRIAKISRCG